MKSRVQDTTQQPSASTRSRPHQGAMAAAAYPSAIATQSRAETDATDGSRCAGDQECVPLSTACRLAMEGPTMGFAYLIGAPARMGVPKAPRAAKSREMRRVFPGGAGFYVLHLPQWVFFEKAQLT